MEASFSKVAQTKMSSSGSSSRADGAAPSGVSKGASAISGRAGSGASSFRPEADPRHEEAVVKKRKQKKPTPPVVAPIHVVGPECDNEEEVNNFFDCFTIEDLSTLGTIDADILCDDKDHEDSSELTDDEEAATSVPSVTPDPPTPRYMTNRKRLLESNLMPMVEETKKTRRKAKKDPDDVNAALFSSLPFGPKLSAMFGGCSREPEGEDRSAMLQEILLMSWHSSRCSGVCRCRPEICAGLGRLFRHAATCSGGEQCTQATSGCSMVRELLRHYKTCREIKCTLCGPVRCSIAAKHPIIT